RDHQHLAIPKEDEKIRYRDVVAQPRKIISSPIWSGLESEKVCYNAGYTNVHELIPWRTLTGRQQLYQDHLWMRAFGEGFCVYRPPIDTKTVKPVIDRKPNGNASVVLNFITPHQKWGIHNSVTGVVPKPTHMIGGYAQQSYGFNYYGTVGANRDEFVIVRKMVKVDWLDTPTADQPGTPRLEAAE